MDEILKTEEAGGLWQPVQVQDQSYSLCVTSYGIPYLDVILRAGDEGGASVNDGLARVTEGLALSSDLDSARKGQLRSKKGLTWVKKN